MADSIAVQQLRPMLERHLPPGKMAVCVLARADGPGPEFRYEMRYDNQIQLTARWRDQEQMVSPAALLGRMAVGAHPDAIVSLELGEAHVGLLLARYVPPSGDTMELLLVSNAGASAAALSRWTPPAEILDPSSKMEGDLGARIEKAVTNKSYPKSKARLRRAKQGLEQRERQGLVGSAAEEAAAELGEGSRLEWLVSIFVEGEWRGEAWHVGPNLDQIRHTVTRRYLRLAEQEAGTQRRQSRGHRVRLEVLEDWELEQAVTSSAESSPLEDDAILYERIAAAGLSSREDQVLSLVLAGKSYAEIAQQLAIAQNTVKSTMNHVKEKLGRASGIS